MSPKDKPERKPRRKVEHTDSAEHARLVEYIRSRMHVIGMTSIQELADKLKVSHTTISKTFARTMPGNPRQVFRIPMYAVDEWADALQLEGIDREWFHEQVVLTYVDPWFVERFKALKQRVKDAEG